MTRVTTTVLTMMLLLNGSVSIMAASGLSEDLGVNLAPGVTDAMDDVVAEMKKGFSSTGGFGQTLFAMFAAALGIGEVVIQGVFALPQMFLNLGFPNWIVAPFFTPMYLVSTLELIYIGTGRDLV